VYFTLYLIGKLKSRRTLTGSAAILIHATAKAMLFLANAGLIFLTHELTRDRHLVDTGATLIIVPCNSKTTPSVPLLKKEQMDKLSLKLFVKKLSSSRAYSFLCSFFKLLCQVPFLALTS
jgi:hypothetical protein